MPYILVGGDGGGYAVRWFSSIPNMCKQMHTAQRRKTEWNVDVDS